MVASVASTYVAPFANQLPNATRYYGTQFVIDLASDMKSLGEGRSAQGVLRGNEHMVSWAGSSKNGFRSVGIREVDISELARRIAVAQDNYVLLGINRTSTFRQYVSKLLGQDKAFFQHGQFCVYVRHWPKPVDFGDDC